MNALLRHATIFFCLLPACTLGAITETMASEQTTSDTNLMTMYFDDDILIEAATRTPKPITQVAENVTVITAAEIAAMNAHNLAEVLNLVTGVFVEFSGRDYAATSSTHIHGSAYEHVLVLLDGIRWGSVTADYAETQAIPLAIIKRLEVIRGPASSTWGSSLGGVVNIITRETGGTTTPAGTISAAVGEYGSYEYGAEVSGRIGTAGYFLYAGQQESEGIMDQRFLDSHRLYGKLDLELPGETRLTMSGGYFNPRNRYYYLPSIDDEGEINDRALFYTALLDGQLTADLGFSLSLYNYEERFTDAWDFVSDDTIYFKRTDDETSRGASGRLVWKRLNHTAVLGAEFARREATSTLVNDPFDWWTALSKPYRAETRQEDIWAIYVNDTIQLGDLTITPGLRYDGLDASDDLLSPSLGLVYRLRRDTILRGAISHGFRKPTVALKSADPEIFSVPENPALESEKVWSYQAGIETNHLRFCRLKATLFHHAAQDVWDWDPNTGARINGDDFKRTGLELEMATIPFYNIALEANTTYVRLAPENANHADLYSANLVFAYKDKRDLQARLSGHYVWWGRIMSPTNYGGEEGNFVWDLTMSKGFKVRPHLGFALFFSAHNLFDTEQYYDSYLPNAQRWVEAGVKLHF